MAAPPPPHLGSYTLLLPRAPSHALTEEELTLTLTLTLTLSLTLTRRRANPSPSPSPNPSANANQKKSFVRGRGTSNRTQSFFCPVAGCHNVLQHQHLSVR